MAKYYVTPTPKRLSGDVQQITTVYPNIKTTLVFLKEFVKTKSEYQQSLLYVRRVGIDGRDAGVELTPEQIKEKLSEAQ